MTKQIMFAGIIWYLVFALTHAFLSDRFQGCLKYFYKNEAPQLFAGIKDTDRCVCQEYANSVHFATFYDALRKIPHYSAYKLPDDDPNYENKPRRWRIGKDLIPNQQASLNDYNNVRNNELSRGHLAPRSYFNTKRAADVLSNIAPQDIRFNQMSWNYLEASLLTASTVHCVNGRSFFITGVIPSDNRIFQQINIPSYFWTAVCCDTSNANIENRFTGWSFAYIVANVNPENRVIGMFTVEDFLKDVRLGKRYRKLFKDITIGNRKVENCLFDPSKADEIIQNIIVDNNNMYTFFRPIPPPNIPVDRVRSKSFSLPNVPVNRFRSKSI